MNLVWLTLQKFREFRRAGPFYLPERPTIAPREEGVYRARWAEYRAETALWNACPRHLRSVPEVDHGRAVHHSFHANYLEKVKSYHQTSAYHQATRKRKVWVEPLFAEARIPCRDAAFSLAASLACQ